MCHQGFYSGPAINVTCFSVFLWPPSFFLERSICCLTNQMMGTQALGLNPFLLVFVRLFLEKIIIVSGERSWRQNTSDLAELSAKLGIFPSVTSSVKGCNKPGNALWLYTHLPKRKKKLFIISIYLRVWVWRSESKLQLHSFLSLCGFWGMKSAETSKLL